MNSFSPPLTLINSSVSTHRRNLLWLPEVCDVCFMFRHVVAGAGVILTRRNQEQQQRTALYRVLSYQTGQIYHPPHNTSRSAGGGGSVCAELPLAGQCAQYTLASDSCVWKWLLERIWSWDWKLSSGQLSILAGRGTGTQTSLIEFTRLENVFEMCRQHYGSWRAKKWPKNEWDRGKHFHE